MREDAGTGSSEDLRAEARCCQGAGHAVISGKSIPGRGNRMCKGSEAGTS